MAMLSMGEVMFNMAPPFSVEALKLENAQA
jgi:hypothetical protein